MLFSIFFSLKMCFMCLKEPSQYFLVPTIYVLVENNELFFNYALLSGGINSEEMQGNTTQIENLLFFYSLICGLVKYINIQFYKYLQLSRLIKKFSEIYSTICGVELAIKKLQLITTYLI